MTPNEWLNLADLVDKVIDGHVLAEDAVHDELWQRAEPHGSDVYHAMHHYAADADIRARDPEYAASQRAGLRKLAEKLRQRAEH